MTNAKQFQRLERFSVIVEWFWVLLHLGLKMFLSEEGPVEAGLFRDLHPSRDIPIFVYWFSAERDIMQDGGFRTGGK